jgi:hypothetical protein
MSKKALSLEQGAPPRVELEWGLSWKNMRVRFDGAELGVIADQNALKEGRDFDLPDGHRLRVRLVKNFPTVELQVTRDGVPLPGSGSDPAEHIKHATHVLYFIAGLNVLLGVIAGAFPVAILAKLGIGWANVVEGIVYAGLGYGTSKRSAVALGLGMGLFGLDTVFVIAGSFGSSSSPVGGLLMRAVLFVPLVKGLRGMTDLRRRVPARA